MNLEHNEIIRGRPRIYNYPKTLICTITGRVVKVNPKLLHEKLQKEGKTFEEYQKNFVARKTHREINQGTIKIDNDGKPVEIHEKPPKRPDFAHPMENRKNVLKTIWKNVCKELPEFYQDKYKP